MTINQLYLFIIFLITGGIIGILFDIFRILRKSFRYKDYIIDIQDVIFWILTASILLYSSFIFNDGEIRMFMILSSVLGFIIYLFTLSKLFIKINVKIILIIKKFIVKTTEILLIPIKKLFFKPFTFFVINIKKTIKSFKLSKNKKSKNKNNKKEGI